MQKVILTTGGTGGHIFPALSVARELENLNPKLDILFVGSLYGPEKELCAQAGLAFHGYPVRGFLGRGVRGFSACAHMLSACGKAFSLLRAYKPDVVAGFGGYASFPALFASYLLRIPRILHEQNAVPGMCNRVLGKLANRVCVSLPDTEGFAAEKVLVTGNPIRERVLTVGLKERSFQTRHLLVLGGSQGAHALNTFMCDHLDDFVAQHIEIVHQTGTKDEEWVRKEYLAHGLPGSSVRAFIDDMPALYAWADLALCRSGASTIFELCACGLPAILIPFPYAIHDHQTKNAHVLTDAGAALLIQERDIAQEKDGVTPGKVDLFHEIVRLFQDPGERAQMSHNARKIARPDAAAQVAKVILQEVTAKGRF